jgi:hypothetical protein
MSGAGSGYHTLCPARRKDHPSDVPHLGGVIVHTLAQAGGVGTGGASLGNPNPEESGERVVSPLSLTVYQDVYVY